MEDGDDERATALSARQRPDWARLRDIPLAILAWVAVFFVALWFIGHVAQTLLVLALAGLLAYALAPLVKRLTRWLPLPLATGLVYVVFFVLIGVLVIMIVQSAAQQVQSLARMLQDLLTPAASGNSSGLLRLLRRIGLSTQQIQGLQDQILGQARGAAADVLPIVGGVATIVVDVVVVTVLSVYFVLNGPRIGLWLCTGVPAIYRPRTALVLDTLNRVVGGYIRGQLTLAALVGVLVGIGMAALGVPYAILLGVLAFVLEFIPFLGVIISGVACVLVALSVGWVTALLVLAYFVLGHVIEGDVVGPRIVGPAIGLHPAVALIALIAFAELFGLWGALFAAPVAGVLQALAITLWQEWRTAHPEHFPTGHNVSYDIAVVPVTTEKAVDGPPVLTGTQLPGRPPAPARNASSRRRKGSRNGHKPPQASPPRSRQATS